MSGASSDVLVVGGGLGGVAAALAAARSGRSVVLTEETDWLGGQLTSQGVPPDEHPWIEQLGCTRTYRQLRDGIRAYYRRWYPLTDQARGRPDLNPGLATVSSLCHEPRVAVAVIDAMLAPYRSAGRLRVLLRHQPVAATVDRDRVTSVTLHDLDAGHQIDVQAAFVLDATETGELLPLTATEHVTGFESQADTGEPSAPEAAQPDNWQAASWCFVVEHRAGEDHTIAKPDGYTRFRNDQPAGWCGTQLSWTAPDPRTLRPVTRTFDPNPDPDPMLTEPDPSRTVGDRHLWLHRRIAARLQFTPGTYDSDLVLVNWPMIDYLGGPVLDSRDAGSRHHRDQARQLSLSMLFWMQTEAPRHDGGTGYPGLRLRGDVLGTTDGLAKAPYIRESRRIRAVRTVVEQDVAVAVRGDAGAVRYDDSVGIGSYRIDLHPSTGGDSYLDVASCPFEIPLGALLPVRVRNLLPAAKNIGTTHITNGCYRLHPVEWNVGEVAGELAAHCLDTGVEPHAVHGDPGRREAFQARLEGRGVELRWPSGHR